MLSILLLYYFILLKSIAVTIIPLPGLDEIQSGFDAAKMLSSQEQNSTSRIFNLDDGSVGDEYVSNVLDTDHVYSTPSMVQVTTIDSRIENYGHSIAYSFKDFCLSYFESYSFEPPFTCKQYLSNSNYHPILKKARNITKTGKQTVIISTVWWGLYSIQLAPTFLLNFDQMFNRSIQTLNTHALNPTTEEQQSLYNEFIKTFGTHYISSVVIGGLINIYTFINPISHSEYNYSEISQQISLFIKNMNESTVVLIDNHTQKNSSSTLLKNSQTFILYKPSINTNGSKLEWSVWTHAVDKYPSVINRTLFSLTNLLIDYPEVQNHLQKTIDYYQEYNTLPSLAQLTKKRSSKFKTAPLPLIPGLDIVGCGFDILSVQSKMCLVDIKQINMENQYNDAFDLSLNYLLPNGFDAIDTPDSLSLNFSIQIRSVDDYYKSTFYSTHSDSSGFLGFGASHYYKSITTMYRRFYEENYYLALRLLQIKWYTLSLIAFPYPKLNNLAQAAINKLPKTFNPNNTAKFDQFFFTFGTHFVQSADMGGLVQAEIWYKTCLLYQKSETWINEQTNRYWWFFQTSQSSSSYQLSVDEQFKEYSMFSSKLIGGNQFMNSTLWKDWVSTVKSNPQPIQYRLKPIYTLLPEGQQRTSLAEALAYLRRAANANATEYISQLQQFNPPPEKDCDLVRRKRDVLLKERHRYRRSLASNANAARQALCPIVGYNGSFCPGTTENIESTSKAAGVVPKLHRGVGMTIDITTGKLTLPVLELTYSSTSKSKIWKDVNGTGQSFLIPNEVTLTLADASRDNKPGSYIYPTAMQFADVWTRSSGSGSWVGGSLGYAKSVLDINLEFFSLQQAVAITQQPIGLYRLEVNNLTLNQYAKEALKLLPSTYDASIYTDFIDTWGTHIATSTFIGGMIEQQVVFKKCMLSMLAFIANNILDNYLTEDLSSSGATDTMYTQRRRLIFNRLVGGNPIISDREAWIKTIASNPALLKIDRYIPWSDIITNTKIKQNMQKAVADRLDQAKKKRKKEESENQDSLGLGTINISIGSTLSYSVSSSFFSHLDVKLCAIIGPILVDTSSLCMNSCDFTQLSINTETFAGLGNLFTFVRDNNTGSFHIVFNDAIGLEVAVGAEVYGEGCSAIMPTKLNYLPIFPVLVCSGCTLSSTHDGCSCPCPTY